MKKTLMALAMSLAAVSGAHAEWFSGYNAGDPTVGNGEALFVAFDDVAGKSYIQDLGVRYDDLVSGAAFNGQSFSVDLSVFASSTPINVRWMVAAGSGQFINTAFDGGQYDKNGFVTTFDVNANPVVVPGQDTLIANANGVALAGIGTKFASFSGPISQNGSLAESVAFGDKYVGSTAEAAFFNQQLGQDALGSISGETMELWRYGFSDADGSFPITNLLGTVSLTGNTLAFSTSTPAVPVPAAVWLLGSALAGLGGIARRRNSKA